MEAAVQQDAVDDLLEYCRNEGHGLNVGRQLAPVLLGHPWNGVPDDYALANAIADLVAAALEHWRHSVAPSGAAQPATAGRIAQLKADLAVGHPRLERMSLLHAYYIDGMSTDDLANMRASSRRSIQLKIKDGRTDLAHVIARRTVLPASSSAAAYGQGNGQHAPVPADDGASIPTPVPMPQPSAPAGGTPEPERTHPRVRASTQHRAQQHITGDHVQAVIGPVAGPVTQYQTHHTHHYGASGDQTTGTGSDTTLFWAGLLAAAGVGYWLLHTVPWLSVGALVLLSSWRVARHGWHIRQLGVERVDREERWWYVGHMLAWIGILAWSIFLFSRLGGVSVTAEFPIERLMLVVLFIVVSMIVFWLSSVDVLLWVDATMPTWWPARWLRRHAAWCWQQRWTMLGLTWLMLGVFSATMVLGMLGLSV